MEESTFAVKNPWDHDPIIKDGNKIHINYIYIYTHYIYIYICLYLYLIYVKAISNQHLSKCVRT